MKAQVIRDPTVYETVRLNVGELAVSRDPVILHTLLGSCVAVCLHDRVAGIGGMNHILLPGEADYRKFDARARYGVNAMELLINRIMKLGGEKNRLTAKVFGGGHVLHAIPFKDHVGQRNVKFVMDFLKTENIRVIGNDVGGKDSRKLYFHTGTGQAWVGRIKSTYAERIRLAELEAMNQASRAIEQPGNITLFD